MASPHSEGTFEVSDTYRWIQPGWDGPIGTMSKKHQSRDHSTLRGDKRWRFVKGVKNTRHNILKKVDDLRLKEITQQVGSA